MATKCSHGPFLDARLKRIKKQKGYFGDNCEELVMHRILDNILSMPNA